MDETFAKAAHMKRFVVEDSITKVTSDGEPHEMMTIIAVVAGLLAAMMILAVLVSLVACKSTPRPSACERPAAAQKAVASVNPSPCSSVPPSQRSSVCTIYARIASIPEEPRLELTQASNFEGNLNAAFVESELSFSGSLRKSQRKSSASRGANSLATDEEREASIKETKIVIERF